MLLSKWWLVVFLVMTSLFFSACDSSKRGLSIEALAPFYGTFKGSGRGSSIEEGEVSERDLTVTIKPWEERGFTVDWSTIIYRDGREKETSMSIDFYPSGRPGIFASAMRQDVFGKTVPYNPVVEEAHPYVWASLEGETLVVNALYIRSDGGYEMQIYKRSLHEKGLSLEFERMKNSERVTQISSLLESVAE
uniref:Lipoprotein n=1 Tax=uncultured Thiotrichaceae bacterium TaxID=298394 RepID=A0A6S6SL59_9GAMM|nr:MAG: Unknown protein [uncultured Thiotrichaceae bacterium]